MAPPLSRNESISLEGDLKILVDNHIIDENIVRFIHNALKKVEFSIRDFEIDPKTFKKYIDILFRLFRLYSY